MSLQPQGLCPVPEETTRVARAAFPRGSLYLRMRDELGTLYEDALFAPLFPVRGRPAEAPWRLALVTVLQYIEGLSDRQAADAVRSRLDWKYLLGLELSDAGFDFSVLSEFRARLVGGGLEEQLLDRFLEQCRTRGWLKARGRQRTDSTHILSAARALKRLECVGETLRHALNVLAEVAPEWLRAVALAGWYERYGHRVEDYRLPQGQSARHAYAALIGGDGLHLLQAIDAADDRKWLGDLPAVVQLRQVWEQQYIVEPAAPGRPDQARGRTAPELAPCGERMESPYDPEARFATKRSTSWTGYKVHLTETCDEQAPHLILQVDTTAATTPDVMRTAAIEDALARKELAPRQHLVDSGYVSADELVTSRERHAIDLVGPLRVDGQWQAKARQGYDLARFRLDWEAERAICPQGKSSRQWKPTHTPTGQPTIHIEFDAADCTPCPVRALCTKAKRGPRELTARPRDRHAAMQRARQRQTTDEFKAAYAPRAGIEGTLSQGIRAFGLRQARYYGHAKTHLQHIVTAVAMNIVRVDAWLRDVPLATTRTSRFAALAQAS
jgi:transposase